MSYAAKHGLLRIFPRRTKATPIDRLARVGMPPLQNNLLDPLPSRDDVREIHGSVFRTDDIVRTTEILEAWSKIYPEAEVKLGGRVQPQLIERQ